MFMSPPRITVPMVRWFSRIGATDARKCRKVSVCILGAMYKDQIKICGFGWKHWYHRQSPIVPLYGVVRAPGLQRVTTPPAAEPRLPPRSWLGGTLASAPCMTRIPPCLKGRVRSSFQSAWPVSQTDKQLRRLSVACCAHLSRASFALLVFASRRLFEFRNPMRVISCAGGRSVVRALSSGRRIAVVFSALVSLPFQAVADRIGGAEKTPTR